jgi:cysteine desulfurase family protein (TIGR01976 family)
MSTPFDIDEVRSRFPSLDRRDDSHAAAFLDGPGGTQVPKAVIDAMASPLRDGVSNLGGGFGPSDDAERITADARAAMGRMLGAEPAAISFGQNMTSLTFAMSRALARNWGQGDAVVVTSLDHDANFSPWVMAADDSGAEIRVAEFDPGTGLLDVEAIGSLLDERVRLVAVCLASNALGTVVDIATVTGMAHEVGATVYVDAVHAAPHRHIDVAALGADLLVVSAYKFFGPHTGILYGRERLMSELDAYKLRPAPSDPPGKWETGTQSFESLAGVTAAVEYLESLGDGSIEDAYRAMGAHEAMLGARFLDGIRGMAHVRLHGVPEVGPERVTTFAIAVERMHPDLVAQQMAAAGIYVWSGHYYAVNVMDRLGLLDDGGLVRIGFVHYNTSAEVDRALEVLAGPG